MGKMIAVCGAPGSGKTTAALKIAEEIYYAKKGSVIFHTLSRPSDNPAYDITQEDLVVASLRFNPDIVVVGEMRDTEAYSAVEASLTGHTVVSTIHASAADALL